MVLPLNEQYVTTFDAKGKEQKIPALHPQWKEDVGFVLYQPPPVAVHDAAAFEEWTERAGYIMDDLHWLLQQPHDKFWCQVVFDEPLMRCLDSYLKYAPRSYDVVFDLPPEVKSKHDKLHKLVFMTFLRMGTYKESKENHIDPDVFGEILYENFIFDIPKLMDLCVLYGANNGLLLSKMIQNIFTQQPKYKDDLASVVPTILQVLDNIQKKCGIQIGFSLSPQKLQGGKKSNPPLLNMPTSEFQDIVFYLADTCTTLWSFLDIYPEAAKVFWHSEDFSIRLASAYEGIVVAMKEAFEERDWMGSSIQTGLRTKLHQAQESMLRIFRQILFQSCLQPILEQSSAEVVENHVEDYLHIMSTILSERRFLAHLESLFPFQEDLELLQQSAYTVDETRLQFIQEGITEAYATFGKNYRQTKPPTPVSPSGATGYTKGKAANKPTPTEPVMDGAVGGLEAAMGGLDLQGAVGGAVGGEEEELEGACAPKITGVELESLISSVRDLLPDLGEGFVECCLEEYGYDMEKLINALLEDNLMPSLSSLDRKMPRKKPIPVPTAAMPDPNIPDESLLSQRRNVFDNDEFDVFHRDNIDMSKVHKGKRNTVLDDKADTAALKPFYEKFNYVMEETSLEYDDEYDDTYDSNLIGADDADSADELTTRRPFILPRVLGGGEPQQNSNDTESQESEEEADQTPRDQFVPNPAELRERQAQRQASKAARQRKKGQDYQGQNRPTYDVKGNPKGQGQDSNVLKNRSWKEKNKASRVHHNRKVLADKKRKF